MQQRSKGSRVARTTGDIKRDLTVSQLAGIGAVAMAWNSVESFVDAVLLAGLGLQTRIGWDVTARINAFDAKVALIKNVGKARLGISEEHCEDLWNALGGALGSAKELKTLRDAVIHSQLIDAGEAVGQLVRRDREYDVLLSQEALDGLYDRLITVRDELRIVCWIFLILDEVVKGDAQADLKELQRGPVIQAYVSQVREHQTVRLSLPPLPKFPE